MSSNVKLACGRVCYFSWSTCLCYVEISEAILVKGDTMQIKVMMKHFGISSALPCDSICSVWILVDSDGFWTSDRCRCIHHRTSWRQREGSGMVASSLGSFLDPRRQVIKSCIVTRSNYILRSVSFSYLLERENSTALADVVFWGYQSPTSPYTVFVLTIIILDWSAKCHLSGSGRSSAGFQT